MINFPLKKDIKRLLHFIKFRYILLRQKMYVRNVKKKSKINVVFFAANLPMWRYQHLYDLMAKNNRFNVSVVIAPIWNYAEIERKKNAKELKEYFDNRQMQYIDCQDYNFDIKGKLKPDILFYAQYYEGNYPQHIDSKFFQMRLVCAYPYAFSSSYKTQIINNPFHNYAWKLYLPTLCHLHNAQKLAYNNGKNIVITGYPNADDFLSTKTNDVWKQQQVKKKRVILAPHFSIERCCSWLFSSNFLKLSGFLQEIAIRYSDEIQFAFKPHPNLLTQLYKHKDWGKEKADNYYNWWRNQENTQLETGEYIDLFKSSDAMIHDCGSFSIEYFYTQNPVMFISRNLTEIKQDKNEVGKVALDTHYIAENKDDIINFIENTVLKGIDPMKQQRKEFFQKYLLPPNGKTVAQNTMDDILKSLNIQ